MQAIINFLSGIGNFFLSVFDLLLGAITGMVDLIKMLFMLVEHLPQYFSIFPDACASLLVTLFGIVVIYKILGRE